VKKIILLSAAILILIAAFMAIKPLQFLLPTFVGVKCHNAVCIDDPNRLETAQSLYAAALQNLQSKGIATPLNPRFVYCSTAECYKAFGGGNERAISFPFLGAVIAPESWQVYITQHEFVHWLQFTELGAIATMRKQEWFREGMAYYFSDAPVADIPPHYLPMIERYQQWHGEKSWSEAITEAKNLH